jgi:OmcA/MtrC family decaheme c-type cytochrome
MKNVLRWFLVATLAATLGLVGCSGDDGSNGANGTNGLSAYEIAVNNGFTGTETEWIASSEGVQPESCAICHDSKSIHDTALVGNETVFTGSVTNQVVNADGSASMTFNVQENGANYTGGFKDAATQGAYSANAYVATLTAGEWVQGASLTIASTSSSTGFSVNATNGPLLVETDAANGNYTFNFPAGSAVSGQVNRLVFYARVYRDTNGDHANDHDDYRSFLNLEVDDVPATLATKDLVSNDACFQCHFKGNYIAHGGRTDEMFCVVCHNPDYMNSRSTPAPEAIMVNMIHGIHNSEANGGYSLIGGEAISYPQSMSNCATCHKTPDQLAAATDEANFKPSLCQSCHGGADKAFSINNLPFPSDSVKAFHSGYTEATNCQGCHSTAAGIAPILSRIHDGYDKVKELGKDIAYYTPEVTANGSTVTIVWGAYKISDSTPYNVTNLDPAAGPVFLGDPADRKLADGTYTSQGVRILVGAYGWGTNDIAAYDDVSKKADLLANTTYDAATGKATTTVTLSKVVPADISATRGVVGIIGIPQINGEDASVKSVTADFNFDNTTVTPSDDIANNSGCNTCHDNILMHEGDSHGHTTVGEVKACKICHNPSGASGHFAQQSKSFKDYVHLLHAGQPAAGETEGIAYPGNLRNCAACHDADKYAVPDQTKSLGGVVSGFYDATTGKLSGKNNITGPAAIACGGCHKAILFEEGGEDAVTAFNAHTKTMGYRVSTDVLSFQDLIDSVFNLLK